MDNSAQYPYYAGYYLYSKKIEVDDDNTGHHGQFLPPPPGVGPDPVLLRVRGGGVQGPGGGGGPGGQGGQLDTGEDGHIRQHAGDTLRSVALYRALLSFTLKVFNTFLFIPSKWIVIIQFKIHLNQF